MFRSARDSRLRSVALLAILAMGVPHAAAAADAPAKPAAKAATSAAAGKPATAAAPKLSGLKARVAQGGSVALAASSLDRAGWQAMRPHFADLKPRGHTNKD